MEDQKADLPQSHLNFSSKGQVSTSILVTNIGRQAQSKGMDFLQLVFAQLCNLQPLKCPVPRSDNILFSEQMWHPYYNYFYFSPPMFTPFMQTVPHIPVPSVDPVQPSEVQINIETSENQSADVGGQESENLPVRVPSRRQAQRDAVVSSQEEMGSNHGGEERHQELKEIIRIILSKNKLNIKSLQNELSDQVPMFAQVGSQFFSSIIGRIKKLSKTKEELIKYCMRKAFKFVAQRLMQEKSPLSPNDPITKFFREQNGEFVFKIPFKRNSSYKTMNAPFLADIFSSPKFLELYQQFLVIYPAVCLADNKKKLEGVARAMAKQISAGPRRKKRFGSFKRLPWTDNIILHCQETAFELQKYSGTTSWQESPL